MERRKNLWLAGGAITGVAAVGVALWWTTITPKIVMTSDAVSSTRGGREFVISGEGFIPLGSTQVLVGGLPAQAVSVRSADTIVAKAPRGADGEVGVTVINPNGRRATLPGSYRYSAIKPEIDDVIPKVLPPEGGILVTVKGYGFTASAVEVHFHEQVVPAKVIDNTTLTFVAPSRPAGSPVNVNLEVSTPDDQWASDEFGLNYR